MMHAYARRISSPKGFVMQAEGFSPAVGAGRQPAAVGLRVHKRITSLTYRRRLKSRLESLRLIVHLRGRDAGNNTFMNP